MARHRHADLIHQWAEGAEIECQSIVNDDVWINVSNADCITWQESLNYRVKPRSEKKPDVVQYWMVNPLGFNHAAAPDEPHNLKLIFCGETKELIKAEVLK